MITLLGGGSIAGGVQEIATPPMQLAFRAPLIGGFDDLRRLGEAFQAVDRLSEPDEGRPHEHPWRMQNGSGGALHGKHVGEQGEALWCLAERPVVDVSRSQTNTGTMLIRERHVLLGVLLGLMR